LAEKPEAKKLLVGGLSYTKQIRRVEVLRARFDFRQALDLALDCVVAAEGDLGVRRPEVAGSDKDMGPLGPPPAAVTWLACQLCRDLGEYRLEVSLVERWLGHSNADHGEDHAVEQMKWRLATASELLRTGRRPAWVQGALPGNARPSGVAGDRRGQNAGLHTL
jgi:hypothetical protein